MAALNPPPKAPARSNQGWTHRNSAAPAISTAYQTRTISSYGALPRASYCDPVNAINEERP